MSDVIRIRDHGTVLTIGYEDCVKYHGRTNIGGVALGFRLLQRAFAGLGLVLPDREPVTFFTAFPGIGVRDAIEMVTRAHTRGAYRVDTDFPAPQAPEAAAGRFFFEFGYGERAIRLAPRPGVVPDEFVTLGRRCRVGAGSEADDRRWAEMKEELAAAAMAAKAEDLFVVLE